MEQTLNILKVIQDLFAKAKKLDTRFDSLDAHLIHQRRPSKERPIAMKAHSTQEAIAYHPSGQNREGIFNRDQGIGQG